MGDDFRNRTIADLRRNRVLVEEPNRITDLETRLSALQQSHAWQPITKKPAPIKKIGEYEEYLVAGHDRPTAWWTGSCWKSHWSAAGNLIWPTHWMNLPAPPDAAIAEATPPEEKQ